MPILDFIDNKDDEELLHVMDYLERLKDYDDVREFNKEVFQLEKLAEIEMKKLGENDESSNDNIMQDQLQSEK